MVDPGQFWDSVTLSVLGSDGTIARFSTDFDVDFRATSPIKSLQHSYYRLFQAATSPGLKARMGHSLPQALTAWGAFVIDVNSATKFFLRELYNFTAPPQQPVSGKAKKTARNEEIRERYAKGESISELAKAFRLSNAVPTNTRFPQSMIFSANRTR